MSNFDFFVSIAMLVIQSFTAIFLVAIAFTDRMQMMPKGHLLGVEFMCVGMLWSSVHTLVYLITGEHSAGWLPEMRYLTEVGLFIIAVRTMIYVATKKIALNHPATPDPRKR